MRSKPPVVFVHGLFGPLNDPTTFAALAPRRCSAPDLRGYGAQAREPVTFAAQVAELRDHVQQLYDGERVHLVAHSIGAAYAFVVANESPELVASLTSVEGNFSLADAFWSQTIAAMPEDQARESIEVTLSNPQQWLVDAEIPTRSEYVVRAEEALGFQSWRTIHESAIAIVEVTGRPAYEDVVRSVFDTMPVHLVAGQRSVMDWHVPVWAQERAATWTIMPGVGHMIMLEKPAEFGRVLAELITSSRSVNVERNSGISPS